MRLSRGTTFAERYEVIEELGQGGMGSVYRVEDTKVGEEVALKLINPDIAADRKTIERFRNELKTARKIAHRNVCRMFDLGDSAGTHFITMEYIQGEDLKGLIRKIGQMPIQKALSIGRQICEGLAEAHRQGVVHRDLKPGNIMIDKDGDARIMDFGIARSLKAKGMTGAGIIIGTPEYMSPEQAEARDVDSRSDIYSLGVILYEMVTGRVPFEGETPLGIAMKHKGETPGNPQDINPQIPDALNGAILKCLEKDKEKRYRTADELRGELEAAQEGFPTRERERPKKRPITSKEITVTFGIKKLIIPALVLMGLIAAAIFIWRLIPRGKGSPVPKIENSIAVISFENLTGDPRHDGLIKAVPNLMITKFEAMGVPYVVSWERLRDLLKQSGKDPEVPMDIESGFDVCRREGIAVLVTGEITKAGNIFVTNIKALDVGTKKSLASASAQGRGEESILISQIDDLTGRIRQKLDWTPAKAGEASPVSEFTTTSMEAYNDFLRGRDLYDKWYLDDARRALEKAIEKDPGFASAHLYLAYVYGGLRNVDLQTKTFEKAKTLSGKATEKERLYIDAAYASAVEKDPEKRYRILRELARKYPKEKRSLAILANYFRGKKMFPEAIAELDKALALDPNYGSALEIYAYVSMDMGEMDKATEYLKKYTAVSPGDAAPYVSLGDLYFHSGRLDQAIASYQEALRIKPNYGSGEWIACLQAIKGEYREALASIEEYIKNAPSSSLHGRGLQWKAYYMHQIGRRDSAIDISDEAIQLWKSTNPYGVSVMKMIQAWFCYDRGQYDKGRRLMQEYFDFNEDYDPPRIGNNTVLLEGYLALLDVKQERTESARQRLNKLRLLGPQLQSQNPRWTAQGRQIINIVQAEVLLAEGKAEEAISAMEKEYALTVPGMNPPEFMSHNMPFEQDVLARAYQKLGNLDKAIEVYRRLLTFDPSSQDRRMRIPVYHCRLARLYEEKGLKDKAVEEYRKFLEHWKDADPGIPEFKDAKARLAKLGG